MDFGHLSAGADVGAGHGRSLLMAGPLTDDAGELSSWYEVPGEAHFRVQKSTFVPSPSTYVAGLAWLPDRSAFAERCLLIPTERLLEVAVDGGDRWVFELPSEKS